MYGKWRKEIQSNQYGAIPKKSQHLSDVRSWSMRSSFLFIRGIHSCAMTSRKTQVEEIEIFRVNIQRASSDYKQGEGRFICVWLLFMVDSPINEGATISIKSSFMEMKDAAEMMCQAKTLLFGELKLSTLACWSRVKNEKKGAKQSSFASKKRLQRSRPSDYIRQTHHAFIVFIVIFERRGRGHIMASSNELVNSPSLLPCLFTSVHPIFSASCLQGRCCSLVVGNYLGLHPDVGRHVSTGLRSSRPWISILFLAVFRLLTVCRVGVITAHWISVLQGESYSQTDYGRVRLLHRLPKLEIGPSALLRNVWLLSLEPRFAYCAALQRDSSQFLFFVSSSVFGFCFLHKDLRSTYSTIVIHAA